MISRRALFGVTVGAIIAPAPRESVASLCRAASNAAEGYLFHRSQVQWIRWYASSLHHHITPPHNTSRHVTSLHSTSPHDTTPMEE